jgi:hypothetical protein
MRITMGHPDYVYRPLSQEQRNNMRAAARRRLGIPDGYRRVFGALVDEAAEVRRALMRHRYRRKR